MAQASVNLITWNRELLFEQIVRALDRMPEDLREVFVQTHYEGRPAWEVAERMHLNGTEIHDRISRARNVFFRSMNSNRH